MLYGAIVTKFVGTFVRWIFKGFNGSFKEVWDGPETDDLGNQISYEFISNIIGFITIATICITLVIMHC